jgi:hypothetical protein
MKVGFIACSLNALLIDIGQNFENPKVFTLTGHGVIRRKPVADDGKSLRSIKSSIKSRQSADGSFLGSRQSSILTRTPTSFENLFGDDMSLGQSSKFVPDVPSMSEPLQDIERIVAKPVLTVRRTS